MGQQVLQNFKQRKFVTRTVLNNQSEINMPIENYACLRNIEKRKARMEILIKAQSKCIKQLIEREIIIEDCKRSSFQFQK